MKFDTINEINEAIKAINNTSFRIRLCALNSQISIFSFTHTHGKTSGFSPISEELIRISNIFEKRAHELFFILHESLHLSTRERKVIRNQGLQKKFFFAYNASKENRKFDFHEMETSIFHKYESELADIRTQLETHFKSLTTIIFETLKVCKYSRPLVYSVKIESANVGENQEVFSQLAEELSNSILKIETLLKQIQVLNLELQYSIG